MPEPQLLWPDCVQPYPNKHKSPSVRMKRKGALRNELRQSRSTRQRQRQRRLSMRRHEQKNRHRCMPRSPGQLGVGNTTDSHLLGFVAGFGRAWVTSGAWRLSMTPLRANALLLVSLALSWTAMGSIPPTPALLRAFGLLTLETSSSACHLLL